MQPLAINRKTDGITDIFRLYSFSYFNCFFVQVMCGLSLVHEKKKIWPVVRIFNSVNYYGWVTVTMENSRESSTSYFYYFFCRAYMYSTVELIDNFYLIFY